MQTLKEKLNTLKEKHDQEKTNIIKEDFILKSMPIEPNRVHIYELYGTVASVHFGDDFRDNGINKTTLIKLLKELPAESMYLVNDGCQSFRATKDQNERAENIEVNPINIKIKNFNGTSLEFNWYYKLDNKQLIRIDAIITDQAIIPKIANISYNKVDFRGGSRIDNVCLFKQNAFKNFQHIRWASGSNEYVNDFTLYSESKIDLISILENL